MSVTGLFTAVSLITFVILLLIMKLRHARKGSREESGIAVSEEMGSFFKDTILGQIIISIIAGIITSLIYETLF